MLVWLGELAAHRAAAVVRGQLRQRLLSHVLRLGPRWLAGQRSGEPTAHLDQPTALALATDLTVAARDRTTLLVSHSAELLSAAGRVVRLPGPARSAGP